ncbi:uncharacterized protein LOC143285250 [Babylonia areolata]|uniref:uncharacterized protein LOC143285250 n=1 Tax=Babylonia areolata TaxID=304850 RepID=UPI003FCFA659
MREGNEFASPVFKKRFARRKTTHRPFTFARNFENEESSSASKNTIVSQVGDRGVVITTPVQLSKGSEGLTISDIVRQSPVPVLIAHSTPKEKQKEHKSDEEDEDDHEANTSLLRRSFRSREPSEQFLSRRQYPHGTPQRAKAHHAPDEYYIGSKNTSNIDDEVSITDEGGHSIRKGISASSKRGREQSAQKSTELSASGKMRTGAGSQSKGTRFGTKDSTTKRGSSRKITSSSAKRGRGQGVLDRTPSPLPSDQEEKTNSSEKLKKSGAVSLSKRNRDESVSSSSSRSQKSSTKTRTPPSSLPSKGGKTGSVSVKGGKSIRSSTKKGSSQSVTDRGKDDSMALRRVDKTLSQNKNNSFFSEYDGAQTSSAEDSDLSGPRSSKNRSFSQGSKQKAGLQREKENRPSQKNKGTSSPPSSQEKRNKTTDFPPPSTRRERRLEQDNSRRDGDTLPAKRASQSEDDSRTVSSSAKKRKVSSAADKSGHLNASSRLSTIKEIDRGSKPNSGENGNASPVHVPRKIGKDLKSAKTSSAMRRKKISLDENGTETSGPSPEKRARNSQLNKTETSISQHQSARQESLSSSTRTRRGQPSFLTTPGSPSPTENKRKMSQPRNHSQNSSVPDSSHKRLTNTGNKSSKRVVIMESDRVRTSPRSNSFWKTSRRIDSSSRPKRPQQQRVLNQSVYDDDSFGEREVSSFIPPSPIPPGKAAAVAGQRKSEISEEEEEERPKRRRSTVTELRVIANMLEQTDTDIMEDCEMTWPIQKAVHKALTFTKKQLKEMDSRLEQISELDYQVKKLKSVCKEMSSESKEKLQQKFILQKELQSLKSQGIDADMMCIDRWMQDYQGLRQSKS